jgi:DNA polymerase III delta prime subunit
MKLPIYSKSLHHAYFIVGDKNAIWEEVIEFLKKELSFLIQANPDFWSGKFDTFTIDDARNLTELHIRKPFAGDRKIFLMSANSITVEAQNALLKLFEEPILGNHFFLVMPEDKTIIPTLRSRLSFVSLLGEVKEKNELGKKFLGLNLSDRLKWVGKISERKSKEEAKELVRSIMDILHQKSSNENSTILKDLIKAEDYLSDRSPSIKMLLEHIAHITPTA